MNETTTFPEDGLPSREVDAYLEARLRELPDWHGQQGIYRLGFPITAPLPESVQALVRFLPANANNIGMHLRDGRERGGTRRLEAEALAQIAALVHGDNVQGYITGGGTESNLYGLWVGRDALRAAGRQRIAVVTSSGVHNSVTKAARILDLPLVSLPLLRRPYTLSGPDVTAAILGLRADGYDGFVVVSTAGYLSTGLLDPIADISAAVAELETACGDIGVHHHVDAAIGGFILPFSNPDEPFDFRNARVDSLSMDAHKMGLLPYACGIAFCRAVLAHTVGRFAGPAGILDETISGSRSGAMAAALWATINTLGASGYRARLREAIRLRDTLAAGLRAIDRSVKLIARPDLNILAFGFGREPYQLPELIERRYRLIATPLAAADPELAPSLCYRVFVMPGLSNVALQHFLDDIREARRLDTAVQYSLPSSGASARRKPRVLLPRGGARCDRRDGIQLRERSSRDRRDRAGQVPLAEGLA